MHEEKAHAFMCVCVSQCCWVNHTLIGAQIQEQLIKEGSQSGIRAKLAEQGQKHGTTILGKKDLVAECEVQNTMSLKSDWQVQKRPQVSSWERPCSQAVVYSRLGCPVLSSPSDHDVCVQMLPNCVCDKPSRGKGLDLTSYDFNSCDWS